MPRIEALRASDTDKRREARRSCRTYSDGAFRWGHPCRRSGVSVQSAAKFYR